MAAVALVVVHPDIARSLKRPLVTPIGAGYAVRQLNGGYFDILQSGGVRSGAAAYAEAGVEPTDIQYASLYDSFTITVLVHSKIWVLQTRGGWALRR